MFSFIMRTWARLFSLYCSIVNHVCLSVIRFSTCESSDEVVKENVLLPVLMMMRTEVREKMVSIE